MSDFFVYDPAGTRIGILEHWSSIQWLEKYADAGEAKVTALACTENIDLLQDGNRIYNPDTQTSATIVRQEITDDGKSAAITVRAITGAGRLADRVCMGTVKVKDAEMGIRTVVQRNLRGLPMDMEPLSGHASVKLDTQISWGNVLDALKSLARASGVGFGCSFDPRKGRDAFGVRHGMDRTQGAAYNGYFGDDIANISNIKLLRGTSNSKNVAVVCGQGTGSGRVVVTVGQGTGDSRREMWVDAKDIEPSYQQAVDTGQLDRQGSPVYQYNTVQYTPTEYQAMLAARGWEKLAEHGAELTLSGTALDGGTLTFGKDYGLGDMIPIKLTRYGTLAVARVMGVRIVYEATGRRVEPVLSDFNVGAAAAVFGMR